MRIQLPRLFRGHRLSQGSAPQSLRAGRKGDGAHVESARGGVGQGSLSSHARAVRRRAVDRRAACPVARATVRRKPGSCRGADSNKESSAKETWHIEFDLTPSGLDYRPGNSFGVFAKNDLGLVDQIIAMLGASHITEVRGKTLREALQSDVSLGSAPDTLFDLFSFLTGGEKRQKARLLAHGEDPDGDAAMLDVLAVLQKFSGVRPHPEAFVEALEPLQPRLYSISSSPKAAPGKLSLTVDAVRYVIGKRKRLGVASTFLAERIAADETLPVYVQAAHNFALPEDPQTPIVMVGPGTGVAPFRAFLHERAAVRGARQKLAVLSVINVWSMTSFTPTNSTR